eukprot:gene9945-2127_t
MSDKQYKWQVKPGGTIPADALDVKHATSQSGSVSQRAALQINKGGDSAPKLDSQSQGIAHSLQAPKPPQYVNAVAKDQAVRHNATGY